MYLQYFGLSEAPFSITPDPAFVYLSARHRDALAHLLYGVGQGGSGGFVQLTGEVGTGKTTLCRCLLEQVPEDTRIALILNPLVTPVELLAAICDELEIGVPEGGNSSRVLFDALSHYLLDAHQAGMRVVVVIDEAQNLSPEALEQVRLLTNLETSKEKLLQIILLGQPELRDLLQRRSLRQLAQRITARYHLTPLGARDTALYVQHRMRIAGAQRSPFRKSALHALFQRSHGVPRLINIIADRALVGAYAREREDIDARLVHAAADEVQQGEAAARRSRWPWAAVTAAMILLVVAIGLTLPTDAERAVPAATGPASTTPLAQQPGVADDGQGLPQAPLAQPQRDSELPGERLDQAWLATQTAAAWQGLAAEWGDANAARDVETACAGAAGRYACVRDRGNWSRIRQLGLPVVLELWGETPEYLLLRGIDDRWLLAGTRATSRTLARAEVEARWLGDYFIAWPQSSDWPRAVRRGDDGPAVQTILALARDSVPPWTGAPEFDGDFEQWLVEFQRRHGLEGDGIVGPKTLLYLMRHSIDEPRLRPDWPGRP